MYSHRSGLPDHAGDLLEDMGYGRAEVLKRLRFIPTKNNFRSHYAYTNFGMTEGAIAAANGAGISWEDLSEERLYKRLGMTSTSSRLSEFLARTNRARGHVLLGGSGSPSISANLTLNRQPAAPVPASATWHDGCDCICTTARSRALPSCHPKRSQKPIGPTWSAILEIKSATELYSFYGLGWGVRTDELGRVVLSHSGAFALGAGTAVQLLPSEQLGVIVLTNAQPVGLAEALGLSFVDLATSGKVQRDWLAFIRPYFEAMAKEDYSPIDYSKAPSSRSSALPNNVYAGTYANDLYGHLEVVVENGKLAMKQGLHKLAYPLSHYDHDTFYYETAGENAVGLSGVTFIIEGDGKASRVVVENLNKDGLGTFARLPGK